MRIGQDNGRVKNALNVDFAIFLMYIFVLIISLFRATAYGDIISYRNFNFIMIILYTASILTLSGAISDTRKRGDALEYVCMSVPLLSVVSFLLDAINGSVTDYFGMFLSGVRVSETVLISGANTNAITFGFGFVVSAYYLFKLKKAIYILPLVTCLFYVLAARSQGMIFSSVIVAMAIPFERYIKKYIFNTVLVYWIFSAKIQISLYGLIENSDLRGVFERSGAGLGVGTGRTFFWEKALSILDIYSFWFLFGYGYFGALKTSLVSEFAYVFNVGSVYEIAEISVSLHNASLQYLYECGAIGVLVFVLMVSRTFEKSSVISQEVNSYGCVIFVLLYIVLTGTNEATGTIYQPYIFYPLIGIVIWVAQTRVGDEIGRRKPLQVSHNKVQ